MKNWKSTESLCLIILTIYTNDWSAYNCWHVYCRHAFFSARFWNMCKPRKTFNLLWQDGPPALAFYGSGQACLLSWLGMVNSGCLSSMPSEIFLKMKFIIFACSRRLFCIKMLKLGFWNFELIFLGMQFSLVALFFSLVFIICLSWYFHLKLSHEFLTFTSFNIWR